MLNTCATPGQLKAAHGLLMNLGELFMRAYGSFTTTTAPPSS